MNRKLLKAIPYVNEKMVNEKLLFDKKTVANMLSVSVRTVENLIAAKQLEVRHIGSRTLVTRKALQQFARQDHTTQPLPAIQPSGDRDACD